jgi:hypothetical protein
MKSFVLSSEGPAASLWAFLKGWKSSAEAGHPLEVVVRPYDKRRTSEQNRLLWAALTDISDQVDWHGQKLSPQDWKEMLSASLKRQRAIPGIDGGFVILGASTSRMTVGEMSELIELAHAFGAQHGVKWEAA